jgi:hypothetical protein
MKTSTAMLMMIKCLLLLLKNHTSSSKHHHHHHHHHHHKYHFFLRFWLDRKLEIKKPIENFYNIVRKQKNNFLEKDDFKIFLDSLIRFHPGLAFLATAQEFQERYAETVIIRIFFAYDRRLLGKIFLRDLRIPWSAPPTPASMLAPPNSTLWQAAIANAANANSNNFILGSLPWPQNHSLVFTWLALDHVNDINKVTREFF